MVAVTAFIGSIFGAGGGSEASNSQFLADLTDRYGADQGRAIWDDFMQTDDPEAPTTIDERFEYGTFTGGDVTGSVVLDEGTIVSFDPRIPSTARSLSPCRMPSTPPVIRPTGRLRTG